MPVEFNAENIETLFGTEAAEQEDPYRLRKYFFKSHVYEDVRASLPLRILVGHKGIGKSAMFKVCFSEDTDANILSLWIRPDDVLNVSFESTTDLNVLIRNWKSGLLDLISSKIVGFIGGTQDDPGTKILTNTGAAFVNGLITYFKAKLRGALDETVKATLANFLNSRQIHIYFDDLDRGWEGRVSDIRRISALLNALRDMSTDYPGLYFRVALRADVYFLVRTSDESTDKIERSVVWYSWTNHEIFKILVKRVGIFSGQNVDDNILSSMSQPQMAKILDFIMEPRFLGKGHWANAPMHKVLLSLIRKRPRDLVKLCSEAATHARRRKSAVIGTKDLESVFENYSQGRLQDTINEYKTELPQIERLLFGMKPSKKERTTAQGYQYTTGGLLQKISQIAEQGRFSFVAGNVATPQEIANFMYKINFITARKERDDGEIDRKYFEENRYVSSKFVDFGYDWEVHPAYRWALQPDTIDKIFDKLALSALDFDCT